MRPQLCITAALGLLAIASSAFGSVTATASSSDGKSVQATFDRVDDNLVIRLSNLSTADVTKSSDILTGVYFNTSESLSMTYRGAATATDSQVVNGADRVNLNGQWAFGEGARFQSRTGAQYGVGAASLGGLFKGTGSFDFGLTSLGDEPSNPTSLRNRPLVQNEVIIVLSGLSADFNVETDITSVIFQFGAKRRDPRLMGNLFVNAEELDAEAQRVESGRPNRPDPAATPAPTALAGGLALMGYLASRRRRLMT